MYALTPQSDFLDAAFVTVLQIHQESPPEVCMYTCRAYLPNACPYGCQGDILVFLTGQDEIESLEKLINDAADTCVV